MAPVRKREERSVGTVLKGGREECWHHYEGEVFWLCPEVKRKNVGTIMKGRRGEEEC